MIKLLSQPLLLVILCISSSYSQVRLTAVDPVTQNITIQNFGNTEVDISGYRLCSHLTYTNSIDVDATVSIITGDLVLSQNEAVTLNWTTSTGLDVEGRDLGLYLPGPLFVGFDDPDLMVDFMQYLGSFSVPSGRENVAVAKGIWTAGNFVNANGPYTYNGNGTDFGVSFWEGATPACEITALTLQTQTPCDPATNTYTQEILITYANEPGTGTLDVNGQSFPITVSPQMITLTGLIADGQQVDMTARFSENFNCFLTELNFFTAPQECTVCVITDLAAGAQTGCDPATNTYTQEVTVTYQNDPVGGSLDVNGQFFSITGSPQMVTLTGLVANGLDVAVTARFTADTVCSLTTFNLFVAPPECANTCNILALFAGRQTVCDPGTNTYTQEVTVAYVNDPGSGTLDVNGQSFTIASSPQTVTLVGLVANGAAVDVTASFSADSTCIFTESTLFIALEDCIPNVPPVAEDDTASTETNLPVTIEVLTNDSDSDGTLNPESVQIVDAPGNGLAQANMDGTITYTPNLDFSGTDSFTYTVEDDQGATSNLATVFIAVELITALNSFSDPVLSNISFMIRSDGVYLQVNQNRVNRLKIYITDIKGHILQQGEFINSVRGEYVLPIPKFHFNDILVIRVKTNEGSYTKKMYLQSR